ncbi:MAG: ribosome maturation factor RimP [Clostridia bacterium]
MSVKIVAKARAIAEEIVKRHGVELVDVEFLRENNRKILRVYIYKPSGITLEDCSKVHLDINGVIDEHIDLEDPYDLEVSSPGYDRALKTDRDFERVMGTKVSVKLYAPMDGEKIFEGILKQYKDGVITLETDRGVMEIEKEKTAKVKRVFEI